MRRLIAAINMTIDGYCDHTAIVPDDEVHRHYAELLGSAGAILYGRITYQLMKYWQDAAANPTGNPSTDGFAEIMDSVPKIVFSNTLKDPEWASARLALRSLEDEAAELKKQPGKDIFAGSRSIIMQLMKLDLLDEFQLCIHPVAAGGGLPLFENMNLRTEFKLTKTKTLGGGAIILYYEPLRRS